MNLTSPGHIYSWDLFRVRTQVHRKAPQHKEVIEFLKKIMVKLHYIFLINKITHGRKARGTLSPDLSELEVMAAEMGATDGSSSWRNYVLRLFWKHVDAVREQQQDIPHTPQTPVVGAIAHGDTRH